MKVICCLCGLLRLEEEPCLICEGDDADWDTDEGFDNFLREGLRTAAGDVDDTRRVQCERSLAMRERMH